jgi:geranylgeranyl diphosphate synthase type I
MTKHDSKVSDESIPKRNSLEKAMFQKTPNPSGAQSLLANFSEIKAIESRLTLINQAIQDSIMTDTAQLETLHEAAYHLIRAGGKRFRSLVVLLSCEAVGGNPDEALPLCIATEFLQTASLIHDDIIDHDDVRRGVQTVHKKYGLDLAILAADYLIFKAYSLIGKYGNTQLVRIISEAGEEITIGEAAELYMNPVDSTIYNRDQYLAMAQRKTGAFIRGAAHAGTLIGHARNEQTQALTTYGKMIGIAFQIRDDILDITEIHPPSKQTENKDLKLKRANLPLILALEESTEDQRQRCIQAFEEREYSFFHELLVKTDAITKAMSIAADYIKQAKVTLEGIDLKHQDILNQLAELVILRNA